MRCGIFELRVHQHIVGYLSRICDVFSDEVVLFVHEQMAENVREDIDLDSGDITFVPFSVDAASTRHEALARYLSDVERRSTDLDTLLVPGIYENLFGYYRFLGFDPDCPSLLLINNVNKWLRNQPVYHADRSLKRNLVINLKTPLRSLVLKRFDGILVEFPRIKAYIEEEIGPSKPVSVFPPVISRPPESPDIAKESLNIVIPGTVSPDRREYGTVLDAFASLCDEQGTSVSLSLLGNADSEDERVRELVRTCERLDEQGCRITYHTEFVPRARFDEKIRKHDIILSLSVRKKSKREIYGKTSGSGNVFEAIRHGKPIVLPDHFAAPSWIEDSSLTVPGTDPGALRALLANLLTDQTLRARLTRNAVANSQQFTLDRQAERLREILSEFGVE